MSAVCLVLSAMCPALLPKLTTDPVMETHLFVAAPGTPRARLPVCLVPRGPSVSLDACTFSFWQNLSLHSRASLGIPFGLQKTRYKQQRSWDNRAQPPNKTFFLATTFAKEIPAGAFCIIAECCPILGLPLDSDFWTNVLSSYGNRNIRF